MPTEKSVVDIKISKRDLLEVIENEAYSAAEEKYDSIRERYDGYTSEVEVLRNKKIQE